jgi:hypothetical protein
MLPIRIALTALTDRIRADELAAVAAALQMQVLRDFEPEWGVRAVIASVSFESIPAGYIPLIVQDTLEPESANGYHRTRNDDTPYILIPFGPNWPLAASHEVLRLLANPTGSAREPGSSRMTGQGTVEYLIDVCAPCQDMASVYTIDGIGVSDFCTRSFFGGIGPAFSFTGSVRRPFEPAANGVVTWLADDGLLYQARADNRGRVLIHGGFSPANHARMLLREIVDALTPDRLAALSGAPRTKPMIEAEQNARRARFTNMTRFRTDIAWRFGHASTDAATVMPRREIRRGKAQTASRTGHEPSRLSAAMENSLGTAS